MSIKFITDSGSDILAPHDSRLNVLPLTIRFDSTKNLLKVTPFLRQAR